MRALAAHVDLPSDGSWIEQAIEEEAALIPRLRPGPPAGKDDAAWRDEIRARMQRHVRRRLSDQPLGTRLPERARLARADLAETRDQLRTAREELRAARKQLRALRTATAQPATPDSIGRRVLRRLAR
jgi:hypothetical protein